MTVKITLNFHCPQGDQWSEDYWHGASSSYSVADLSTLAILKRCGCLWNGAVFDSVRYATDSGLRDARYQMVHTKGTRDAGTLGPAAGDTAIVYDLMTGGTPPKKRKIWIRGVTQIDYGIDANGVQSVANAFDTNWKAWMDIVIGRQWGIRALKHNNLRPGSVFTIQSVDGTTTPGLTKITTAQAHGLASNSRIIIGRASKKDLPGLNGNWFVVDTPTATTLRLQYATPNNGTVTNPGGYVRFADYDTVSVFEADRTSFSHLYHHDTKNSFFGSRGSKRAARLRQSP